MRKQNNKHRTAKPPKGKTNAQIAAEMAACADKAIALCVATMRRAKKRMSAWIDALDADAGFRRGDEETAKKAVNAITAVCALYASAEGAKGML